MRRVLSYLATQPTQEGHKPQEAGDRQGRAAGWQVREAAAERSDQLHSGAGRTPPNSSDEEVQEMIAGNVRAGPGQDVSRDNGLAKTQCQHSRDDLEERNRADSQAEQGLKEDDGQKISLNDPNEVYLSDNDDERISLIMLFTK